MTTLSKPAVPISDGLAHTLDVLRSAGMPVLLVGRHGIGKSEFLLSYARKRGIAATVLDLSLLEAPDLTGLPYLEGGRTHFAPPAVLPGADSEGPTLLVLEELNRCDRSVRQPCLQLLTSRRLNDYRLPPDCFIVASVNPDEANYEVDALDPALASRFAILRVTADAHAWVDWARGSGVYAPLVGFIAKHPQAFEQEPPRTWTHAARLLEEATVRGVPRAGLEVLLSSVLNSMAVKGLLHELGASTPMVSPGELLRNPLGFRSRFDSWAAQRRDDLLASTLDTVVRFLEHPETEFDPRQVRRDELVTLLQKTPPDLAQRVFHALDERLRRTRVVA